MKVPIYVFLEGQPRRLGFLSMRGSSTFEREIPLPVHPEKVTVDDYHSILSTVRQ